MRSIDVEPDLLIGDMDSISEDTLEFYEEQGVEIRRFPTRKDEIDTELAIMEAEKRSAPVLVTGVFGTRLDQTFAVFRLLERYANVVLFNERLYAVKLERKTVFTSVPGETWSVLPLKKDAKGVSLKGFEYTLENGIMEYLKPYGVSNVALGQKVEIDPGDGVLLVFRYHEGETEWVDELSKIFGAR
jgi:thiamine pyrophosphokinase